MWRIMAAALLAAALSGCGVAQQMQAQQAAQQKAQENRTVIQAAVAQMTACVSAVYNSPEAAPIRARIPMNVTDATLQQLAEKSLASDEEIRAIFVVHPRFVECRKTWISQISPILPWFATIQANLGNDQDKVVLAGTQRKISWGDAISQMKDNALRAQGTARAEAQRIDAGIQQERLNQAQINAARAQANAANAAATASTLGGAAQLLGAGGPSRLPAGASRLPAGAYQLPNETITCTQYGNTTTCR